MRAPFFSIPRTSMPTPTLVRAASRLLLLLALTGWATPAFAVCDQILAYPSNANLDPSFAAPASLPGVTDFSIRASNLGWLESDGTAGLVMPNSPGAGPAVAQWSNLAAIAVGGSHVVGLQKDGTVLTAAEQVSVQNYENFIKNIGKGIAVAAGSSFSAIVRNDGTIRCWGSGDVVKEADYASSFVRIVAADTYLAAIRADGSVAVFGTVQSNPAATPLIKAVPQGLVVKQLAAGQSHLVALTATGSVVAWGSNADGESTVPTGLKDVVAVGAGITTSYALQADGTVVAWGGYGIAKTIADLKWTGVQRLFSAGDSSRLIAFACAGACGPVEASGCCKADGLQICTGGKVVATECAAGTCGWDAGKSTFACGTKGEAKPGDLAAQLCGCSPDCRGKACGSDGCGGLCGGTACPEAPACGITHGLSNKLVEPAGLTAMRQCGLISDDHFWLSVGFDGKMKAWGTDFYVNKYEPTWGIIAGANKATNVAAIATAAESVAALHKDGTVSAWGNDNAGETKVPADLKDVVQIAAGLYAFVALQADGTVRAWGDPKSVVGLDGKKGYVGVYGSSGMIGLVKADGTAELFASGNSGFAPELKNAAPANLKATKLAFRDREAVALQADGSLVAWRIPDSSQFAGDPVIVAEAAKIKGAVDVQGASNAIGVLTGNGVVKVLQAANAEVPTITTLSGVTGFGMSQSGTNFCAVTCSASCYSVTPLGCCTGDVYSVCDKGQLVDKVCAPGTCGWNPSTGLYGCGTDGSAAPMTEWQQQCPIICKPDCTGKICGDDGCGGSCGECGPGQQCSGKQTDICATANDGETLKLECPEGQQITGIKFAEYGQMSGSCPVLEQGACDASGEIAWFIAQCVGKQSCSTTDWHKNFGDPCFGKVKTAGVIATCAADGGGQMCACKPNCDGKTCGPDGCGGLCGTCSGDMPCDLASGQCPLCTVGAVGDATNPPGCISPCGLPTAWGFGDYERTAVPKDLEQVKDLAVSAVTTVAVLQDGTLATWGAEHFGIKAGAVGKTGIITAAASSIHVVAARKDGTVVAWGNNDTGETKVPAGLKDVVAVAAGDEFSAALTSAGTLVTWGSYKVSKANGQTGIKAIAAGGQNLAAIRDDGSVFVWSTQATLKQVPTGLVARQISVSGQHMLALATDGTVHAWGYDFSGELKVPAGLKDVVWVAAGNRASFAVTADGKVTAWGDNTGGQVSNASKLVGVTRLIASKGVQFAAALTCADACGAIGTEGCCQGDTLTTCNALGKKTTSLCAAGTCGWDPGAGRYDCATVGTEDPGANFLRQCGGPCTPDCSSRNCGDDGCGGSCGTCQDGWTCPTNGICICATDCAGKACGGDGCGGSCGVCAGDATCDAGGQCICKPKCDGKTCGDDGCGGSCGTCGANQACGEKGTCVACTPDCNGKSCGSDGCGGSCGTCEAGKGCAADGTCTCVPDCDGKTCGDDGCGWYCGFCPFGQTCNPQLQTCCVPDCKGKVCGDNGCGGSCGSCAKGSWCSDSGTCEKGCKPQCDGKSCGPDGCGGTCGTCDAGAGEVCNEKFGGCFSAFCPGTPAAGCCAGESAETCESLSALVPSIKGTRYTSCAAKGQYCGWIAASSSYGCVDTPNPKDPSGTYPRACPNTPVCVPSCAGKTCGTDGCGGSCGSCGASQQCNFETGLCYDDACADLQGGSCCAGQTLYTCLENNGSIQFGKQICASGPGAGYCGWTGSGYGCGTDGAPAPDQGPAKSCPESICKPNCDGKSCGDDGCGGTCGVCGAEKECKYGKCQDICYPEKTCTASFVATSGESITNHYCKQSDGCGGTCECPAGTECKVEGGIGLCKKPKASNCGEITGACCDGQVLKWCSDPGGDAPKQVASIDCLAKGQFCGYQNGDYDCGTETGVDTFLGKPKYCKGAKQTCEPVCSGKECGPDGCGGTCGSCKDGGVCDGGTGKCITSEGCFGAPLLGCCDGNKLMRCIKPTPTSKATTEVDTCVNGCGWSETEGAYSCNPTAGAAPDPNGNVPMACGCIGNCQGKQCGDDGCGGSCGSCAAGTICKNGFKSTDDGYVTQYCKACTANCSGKVCGDDSCGGSCGTCGAGKECDDTGACVDTPPAPTCQNTPWQGSCNGEKLQYCANGKIFVEDCASTLHCGWNPAFGAYSCGTAGGADPTGQWPKAAPGTKAICVKQCDGRQCGSDGCGGTCGTCVGGALCSYNGICVKDENHDPWYPPSGGCCFPAKDGKPAGRITWASGMKYSACSASNGGTECGDNGYGNMVCGVIGSGINAPTAAQTCKECGTCSGKGPCDTNDCGQSCGGCGNGTGLVCNYGTGQCDKQRIQPNSCDGACGDNNPIHPCQCDEKCGERGDCCENYAAFCKVEKPKPNACGDKQCDKAVGETCATCPFDCGKCQVPSGVQPPWASPFAQVTIAAGTAYQSQQNLVGALDNVQPPPPPYPVDGLVGYLPRPGVSAGPPSTVLVEGTTTAGGKVEVVPGASGEGFGFFANGQPTGGTVRVLLEQELPRAPYNGSAAPGGYTVAGWFKVPKAAPDVANPLFSMHSDGIHNESRTCTWSRKGDARLKFACPPGPQNLPMTVKQIRAYYGSTQGDGIPNGACSLLDGIHRDYRCNDFGVQAAAEAACIGKPECEIDVGATLGDPCASVSGAEVRIVAQVVCDYADNSANAGLVVIEPSSEGGRLRMVGGMRTTRTAGAPSKDVWHHVAVTYHPYPGTGGLGERTLYLDGLVQGVEHGVPQFRFREIVLGAGPVGDAGPVAVGAGQLSPAVAHLDEFFAYDRALSGVEVRALIDKRDRNVLRAWPNLAAPGVVKDGVGVSGGTGFGAAKDLAITEPLLIDPATQGGLVAAQRALGLGKGVSWSSRVADGELAGLKNFTLAGWVRVAEPADGKALLQLLLDGKAEASVTIDKGCDGRAIVGVAGGATTAVPTSCEHGVGATQWAFVALVREGKQQSVWIDGYRVGTVTLPADAPLFAGATAKQVRSFEVGDGVDLAWAALFGRALGQAELQRWRSTGPAVWLDGARYAKDGLQLRDFANFRNVDGTADGGRPRLRTANGALLTGSDGNGPLVLGDKGSSSVAAQLTLPLRGRLRAAGTNADVQALSWAGRVTLVADAPASVPLLSVDDGGADGKQLANRLHASLVCDRSAGKLACRVDAGGLRDDGKWAVWSSTTRAAPAAASQTVELGVAIGFDGTDLLVAFGTTSLAAGAMAPELVAVKLVAATDQVPAAVASNAGVIGRALRMVAPKGAESRFANVRVYPRGLSELELVRVLAQDCSELTCEDSGQVCAPSADPPRVALPACGSCKGDHIETSSVPGGACAKRQGFYTSCVSDSQCASNYCSPEQRCATKEVDAVCKDTCAALYRSCVVKQNGPTKFTKCSDGCIPYHAPPQDDPTTPFEDEAVTGQCEWKPVREPGAVCDSDDECKVSGVCLKSLEPAYNVKPNFDPPCVSGKCPGWKLSGAYLDCSESNDMSFFGTPDPTPSSHSKCPIVTTASSTEVNRGRCAVLDAKVCTDLHREAIVVKQQGKLDTPLAQCGGCEKVIFAGQPMWVKRWRLLSPQLCKQALDKETSRYITGSKEFNSFQGFTAGLMGLWFLDKSKDSKLTPADVAKLIAMGVGPELVDTLFDEDARKAWEAEYGHFWLEDCWLQSFENKVEPGADDLTSPFWDPEVNYQVCAPNQYPDGTTCPPEGVDDKLRDQFCQSGFCARDSDRCEEGYGRLEEIEAADRNDENKSDSPVALVQRNDTSSEFQREEDPTAKADPDYARTYSISTKNTHDLLFFGSSLEIFGVGNTMTGSMGEALDPEEHFDQTIILGGIAFPPPLDPAVGCAKHEWKDGTLSKSDDDKDCEWAEPGAAAAGVLLPTVAYCLPSPGGCEENPYQGTKLKKFKTAGSLCRGQQTFVGPVPIYMEAGVVISPCLEVGADVDGDTGAPGFKVEPSIGIGVEVKGGVGGSVGFVEVFAGVKAAITIVKLGFPITWAVGMTQPEYSVGPNEGDPVMNLFVVGASISVSMELTILQIALSAFAEAAVGNFSVTWEYKLFEYEGIQRTFELGDPKELFSKKIDFEHKTANQ